jgi:ABC-type nitrate/sulfonate/bicarbonate transport system substrate-binding protein
MATPKAPVKVLAVAMTIGFVADALAQTGGPDTVKLAYFTKQPVIEMAQKHGFFSAEKLSVIEAQTAGSTLLFKNLRDGVWDIGLNVADNSLHFRLNRSNPLGVTLPAVIIAGLDNGAGASLMARPEIKTCADARGKAFAVDAPGSGYAYVGYQILRNKCGFEPNVDYRVVTTGGTDRRYNDLLANKPDSHLVLIHTGWAERAEARGMTRFGTMLPDAVSAYAGVVVTASRTWLDAHGDVAVRFLRAVKRGLDYVVDPANKKEVVALLATDGDVDTADRIYEIMVKQTKGGLIRDLGLDRAGLAATAQLRDTWHGWDMKPDVTWLTSEKSGVYDLSYLRRAVLGQSEGAESGK